MNSAAAGRLEDVRSYVESHPEAVGVEGRSQPGGHLVTPLTAAARANRLEMVMLLLELGTAIDARPRASCYTALHFACRRYEAQ